MHTNSSARIIIATTPDEHRFHTLCSEWDLCPHARKQIRQEILDHPEWGIEVPIGQRPYLTNRATVTASAEHIPDFLELPHANAAC
jgi:hypothetical protein